MVGPWSVDISTDSFIYGEDGWPLDLVSPCLFRLRSLTQNRQLELNSNHFPPKIYLKYAACCLKTVVALVWQKTGKGLNSNHFPLHIFQKYATSCCICRTENRRAHIFHVFSEIFTLLSGYCRCTHLTQKPVRVEF